MKKLLTMPVILLIITMLSCQTKQNQMEGTVFNKFNESLNFKEVNGAFVKNATQKVIEKCKTDLQTITGLKKEERTFDNTMLQLDNLYNQLGSTSGIINLLSNVHPDSATRIESQNASNEFNKFENELGLNEELYHAVKDYSQSDEAKQLTGYKKRFLDRTVSEFERNGFALPKEKRDELKKLQDRMSEISIQFEANIGECNDSLIVTGDEMDGLPDDYQKSHKIADGKYKIDMSYPSYRPFMKYSTSEKTRKALVTIYNSRVKEKNLPLLKEMLQLRKQMSEMLGYKTFASYRTETRMAKNPDNVWKFENDMINNLKPKIQKDYEELLEVKRKSTKNPKETVLNAWETSFYNNKLLIEKYSLDALKVKEYFEMNNTINGLFTIHEKLFGIQFNEVKNPDVWHPDVKQYEVLKDNKLVGRFFLDLYPRDNKYNHAASFGMISGKMTANGYQLPVNALVCNFPKPTPDMPSLLTHDDVTTFFHEFGHLMHSLLTQAALSSQSGTSVAMDFVETPSQLCENWAWDYESLKLFAKHYKTGEILPKELYDKMWAARNVGSGIFTVGQSFYGVYDFTLHDKFDPSGTETTTDVYKRLQNEILPVKFIDGTAPEAAFGHLMDYGAGYYSYLWALVYAQDIFSVFEKNGIFDQKTGERYLNDILAKGKSEEEIEMVKNFLGREPNQDAFLKSLGL